ncbi:uncharacterized protein LOC129813492 [Salvelinus fontinalis]|uniref:uncharacterized protein LOC129813492 n=1 Tax=Salvelinus fontinalis TaxID=8038 RepID=UPI002485E31E|nr:uncharacterized protein LOC129813492 [Salvelinus fontinalis]
MVSGDSVTPDKEEYTPTEGSSVSLSCTYETSSSNIYLYWYQQYPNQAPQFLLCDTLEADITPTSPEEYYLEGSRVKISCNYTNKERTCVYLEISSAEVTDSALYYCALRPTVTGNTDTLFKNLQSPGSFLFFTGTSVVDIITPDRDVVDVIEDSSVQLSCRYNSSLTNSLLWYLQHPGSSLQFLIVDYSGIITNTDSTKWTLTHEKEGNRVDLEISSAEVTDSALYYCSLRPTVTGNPETQY